MRLKFSKIISKNEIHFYGYILTVIFLKMAGLPIRIRLGAYLGHLYKYRYVIYLFFIRLQ